MTIYRTCTKCSKFILVDAAYLDSGLHGLPHGLAGDDARGLEADPGPGLARDGAGAVDGVAQSVDHAAEQLVADGDVDDGAGPLHDVALLDELVVAEHDHTDVVGLQVEGHTLKDIDTSI